MDSNIILNDLKKTLKSLGFPIQGLSLEIPSEEKFGDFTTTIALKISREVNQSPLEIAKKIESNFPRRPYLDQLVVVQPGFVNFYLSNIYWQAKVAEILRLGSSFGSNKIGRRKKVQVEFISANPTGPLTLGNGRGGFTGDCLANVLAKLNYTVEREYYLNDRGVQVDILGESVAYAIAKLRGQRVKTPDYLYKGDYILELAKDFKEDFEDPLQRVDEIKVVALNRLVTGIKELVENKLKIKFDVWFAESSLYESSQVEKVKQKLEKKKLVYQRDNSLWFKTAKLGDDKDRVLIKSNGEPTYFLSDVAYHANKFERGFDKVIDIWGADHHGYVGRMRAAVKALGYDERLTIIIIQLVRLIKNGIEVKMSKRAGLYVTMEDLLEEVNLDVARFFFIMHAANTHLDFDLNLAKEKSQKNPVYYVQYAHARISSILKKSDLANKSFGEFDFSYLTQPCELRLIKKLTYYPSLIEEVAKNYSVYRLPYYTIELADLFHKFYSECRVLTKNKSLSEARLGLVKATQIVIADVLKLMGISAPEKM
jgi:arginyl-tRNA synthetase